MKHLTRRSLFAQREPWWNTTTTPWKIFVEHPYTMGDEIKPDYWMDRVLDLCESELTHQYFGLTFEQLMSMDPATFEKIEKRIHDFEMRKSEKTAPELDRLNRALGKT